MCCKSLLTVKAGRVHKSLGRESTVSGPPGREIREKQSTFRKWFIVHHGFTRSCNADCESPTISWPAPFINRT
jgi:hypothetical protein